MHTKILEESTDIDIYYGIVIILVLLVLIYFCRHHGFFKKCKKILKCRCDCCDDCDLD